MRRRLRRLVCHRSHHRWGRLRHDPDGSPKWYRPCHVCRMKLVSRPPSHWTA